MKPEYIFMNVAAPACILLPVAMGAVRYPALPKEARVLLWYLLANAVISIASSALAFYHLPNTPLYHAGTVVETMLMLYFFYELFRQKIFATYILWGIILFPVAGLINSLFFQPILTFNSYTLSLQSLLIILCCFLYWWHKDEDIQHTWPEIPLNWFVSGLLLYFSSSFLLFTFSNMALEYVSVKNFILIWNIHAALSILMFIFISIGFSKYKK
ncbi:hypothetical protein [Ferruginibacter sp. HRS2-29]|uniref:hypothetical protein n=1 Tax=Ferruginibacter sp. HRS2-29 TaxID=2487334 RepID=UPI0020CE76BC|nr:hypothetical protein [Ferruginibacter sp. HRS2-29]MCP9752341.1 hypothetical protein [Ferruginibacter sp. HRS2-29]